MVQSGVRNEGIVGEGYIGFVKLMESPALSSTMLTASPKQLFSI